ncbi:U-scoloptoxin(19)-Sm1a [Neocloeon triangulifer]|uniref:U-scoloptoxin(19)-Sm1a n=1 Tax=Neocloeon triangulifer TaxID=2078957 RepID=UPI00286F916E|nr:U-scoloptoxin(19)-Sm1a [Neocloeon triangulifer]
MRTYLLTLLLAAVAASALSLPTAQDQEEEVTTQVAELPEVAEVEEENSQEVLTTEAAVANTMSNAITNGVSFLNSTVHNEQSCLRTGGNCLPQIECPPGALSPSKGLCPEQQDLGVECCHGLSLLETRCKNRGGRCTLANSCTRALVEDRAEDCPDDKVCCVLVGI